MSPNYWKEKDSTGIISRPVHHGDGNINMRGFFNTISSLPVKIQLWELEPGVSEGAPHPRRRQLPGRILLLPRRPRRDVVRG